MVNFLSNGVDFLSIARGGYSGNGIGLSSRARALNQKFFEQRTILFNTLYNSTEDAELNLAKQINGLRAKLGVTVEEAQGRVDRLAAIRANESLGRNVNIDA